MKFICNWCRKKVDQNAVDEIRTEPDNDGRPELSKPELDLIKQNFIFYEKGRNGQVIERFELPMVLQRK